MYLHVAREGGGSERRGRQNRTAIAFVKVGSHTGHVAYVVAHVIGYRRRVARIVLGNAGLDLADQIGSDVGRFRIDTSADPREERLVEAPMPKVSIVVVMIISFGNPSRR